MDKIETLKQWISESSRIVFFGGAGVSTESGIADFRSVDGLYRQKFEYPPETIISHSFYERKPEYFFRFYREKMLPLGFEPNITRLRALYPSHLDERTILVMPPGIEPGSAG